MLVADGRWWKIGNAVGQISPAASIQIDYVTLANGQIAIVLEVPSQKEYRASVELSRLPDEEGTSDARQESEACGHASALFGIVKKACKISG